MASTSEKNAVCILVMVDCTLHSFRRSAPKTVLKLVEKIQTKLDACYRQWEVVTQKDIQPLHQRIKRFDKATFNGKVHNTTIYTGVLLGLINELLDKTKGTRYKASEELELAVRRLHAYYDRKLNRWADYDHTVKYLDLWYPAANPAFKMIAE